MKNKTLIQTKRLVVRNFVDDDISKIFDYRNNEKCYKYQRWNDTSKEYISKFVCQYKNSIFLSEQTEQHYGICLKDDTIIGDMSYFYNEADNCITLGYTISYKYQRNGYAYEILSGAIKEIKNHYPNFDIVGLVDKDNIASIKLLGKLGFCQECYADKIKSYIYVIYGGKQYINP